MENFIGEIRAFGFNRIPKGWHQCDGTILPIQQYGALFALLGVNFGGNGTTTFALPDLRGRTIIGWSNLYPRIGYQGGTETVTLATQQLPAHRHLISAVEEQGSGLLNNADDYFAQMYTFENPPRLLKGSTPYSVNNNHVTLHPNTISYTGGGQAHNNMMPFQVLTLCIAMEGLFPQRS